MTANTVQLQNYDFAKVDLDTLLDGFDWIHLSGITPALGENCRQLILDCLRKAKEKGLMVSFDGSSPQYFVDLGGSQTFLAHSVCLM